jgi:hypothetical protein
MSGDRRVGWGNRPLIRAPRGRGARIAVAALAVGTLAIPVVRQAAASASGADPTPVARTVSTAPEVIFEGGTPDRRQIVTTSIERYVSVGLQLPDLRVRIHGNGIAGCDGLQGQFHPDGEVGVIDLCFGGEFLALHELGHAWERFNLDDRHRAEFLQLTGLTTWRSTDVTWHDRGAERAANAIAFGLLSAPLANVGYHRGQLAEFEALTGIESPRLSESVVPDTTMPRLDPDQIARLEAYNEWRRTPDPR